MAEMYGKHFEDRFEYAVSDLGGVGQSAAPSDFDSLDLSDFAKDHLAVLDTLGWDKAYVYGGSMGASIATQLALIAPERIKRPALGSFDCGDPNIYCGEFGHVLETRVRYGKSILAQKTDPEGSACVILDVYYGDPEYNGIMGLRDFIIDMLKTHPMETNFPPLQSLAGLPEDLSPMIAALPETADPVPGKDKPRRDFVTGDLWEQVDQLRVPTLLVHGMDDPIVPYQSSVFAASKVPNAELRLYNDMYHSISGSPQILKDIGNWFLLEKAVG